MKINGEFVLREIAGEFILVPIGSAAQELNGMISVNEIGVFIWRKLEAGCSYEQLLESIIDEYEVSYDTAKSDLDEFLSQMKEAKLIE